MFPVAEFISLTQKLSITRWNRFGLLSFIRWIRGGTWCWCYNLHTFRAAFIVPLIQLWFDFNLAFITVHVCTSCMNGEWKLFNVNAKFETNVSVFHHYLQSLLSTTRMNKSVVLSLTAQSVAEDSAETPDFLRERDLSSSLCWSF